MRSINILLSLALTLLTLDFAYAAQFTFTVDGKTRKIETQKFNSTNLSADCFQKNAATPDCDAFRILSKKNVEEKRPDIPLAGHPAAYFCGSIGGLNRILKDEKNNDYDFCEFKDKSLIDAWDLYKYFHKK